MIAVVGAGAIGCYVGGRLAAAGADVVFIGRPRIADEVREHGLHLTDYRGADLHVAQPNFETELSVAAQASLVIVTVKSAATADVAAELVQVLGPDALVLSLQNGVRNAQILEAAFGGGERVLAGMVPFNVVARGKGAFHQGSEGELEVAADSRLQPYLGSFAAAGLPLLQHDDMPAVLWSKLLLNLNNSINALSGLPLKEQLSQRDYRLCLASAQREALRVMGHAGIRPAKITPVPPKWIPTLLSVPDAIFRLLGSKMLEIDPLARSSMADDLTLGRPTEIDWINGEIVRLARETNQAARINERLIELIRRAEQGDPRRRTGANLRAELARP